MRRSSGTTSLIRSSPPVHGGQGDEAADLDVVGADRVVGAAELLLPVHDHHVRADPLDARAHLQQQAREVLHVRLGRGVVDHRRARRERRGHQRVLGRHHRRLVHEEVARRAARRRRAAGSRGRAPTLAPSARKASRCGSRRRRPITSPPGGGMSALPKRASSGPASRNEARMRSAQAGVDRRCWSTPAARTARPCSPRATRRVTPRRASSSTIASTSRMRGMLRSTTSSLGQQGGGERRQRGVLVAGGHDRSGRAGRRLR